jgi:excisionase family DNA binding protein
LELTFIDDFANSLVPARTLAGTTGCFRLICESVKMRISYSIKQLGQITGIGRTTIYAAIRDGHLKARKIRRRTVILHSDLLAFLNALPEVAAGADEAMK